MQTAKDIMCKKVITVRSGMTCEEVQELLVSNKISGAPVVDDRGALLGVISISDILASGQNSPYRLDLPEPRLLDQLLEEEGFHLEQTTEGFASDFMTRKIIRAFPDTPVPRLAELMYLNRIHRLIIVKPHTNKVVGIVTAFDLLKVLMVASQCCDNADKKNKTTIPA